MNIITSEQPLDIGATNMRAVFANIIGDLAGRIINVETGKLHYINGVRTEAAALEPSLSMDLGYCKINMRVYRANLIVLLPSSLTENIVTDVIKSLINEVSIELTKRDVELGPSKYVADDMTFALTQCEFAPAANSFHTDRESMSKRVFEYNYTRKKSARKAAFVWKIRTNFITPIGSSSDPWASDHIDIHVDLANLRIANLSCADLRPIPILTHFGVAPSIVYQNNIKNPGEPYLLPGEERKYVHTPYPVWSNNYENCTTLDPKVYRSNYNNVLVIERPESSARGRDCAASRGRDCAASRGRDCAASRLSAEQFRDEFLKDHHALERPSRCDASPKCQMCWRGTCDVFFTIEKFESLQRTHATVCRGCVASNQMFIELSNGYKMHSVEHGVQFSHVSRDYGIQPSHMELFECRNFQTHGYARDDVTFAVRPDAHGVSFIESLTQYLDDVRARGAAVDIITYD